MGISEANRRQAQRQKVYIYIKVTVVYIIIIKNKLIAVYNRKDSYPKGHASQAKPVQNDRVVAGWAGDSSAARSE